MDEETIIETTWERISNLSLPNQVRELCECIDELVHDRYKNVFKEPTKEDIENKKTPEK